MSEFDFSKLMSPGQIELAHEASVIAHDHLKGAKLYEALKVGEALLIGRSVAVQASGGKTAIGQRYSEAFKAWKAQFGFDSIPSAYLDDCMAAAANRTLSDEIIASLSPEKRVHLGISGLAKRVRAKLKPAVEPKTEAPARAAAKDSVREAHVSERAASASSTPIEALKEEIAKLKAALWKTQDKMDTLAIYLVKEPPPKAEDRPTVKARVWPMPDDLKLWTERRKEGPPHQIVNPDENDPAFALRKEEFEQWLVRRKEALEAKYRELEKSFAAKVQAGVEARMAKEETRGKVFTETHTRAFGAVCMPTAARAHRIRP